MNEGYVAGWRLHQVRRGLVPAAIRRRCHELENLAAWVGEDLLAVSHKDVDGWLDERGIVHPRTRCCYLTMISSFYRWAISERLTDHNPVDRIIRPRLPRYLPRPFPLYDLDRAVREAPVPMRAMLLCGCLAGLRCQEIAGLDRGDILDRQLVPVIVVTAGKGGKHRAVPLHPALAAAVRADGMPLEGVLFPSRDGGRLTPSGMSKRINYYLRSIGVEGRAHMLRHFFGTAALSVSGNLRVVQELMGHSTPDVTAIYTGFTPGESVDAVGKIRLAGALRPWVTSIVGFGPLLAEGLPC